MDKAKRTQVCENENANCGEKIRRACAQITLDLRRLWRSYDSSAATLHEEIARELKNVSREAGRIQRAIEKSTAALNAMQTQRKSAYAKAETEAILLTQLAHAKGQTVDAAKDFPSPELCGGFAYSLPEIARLIGRAARLEEAKARFLSAA